MRAIMSHNSNEAEMVRQEIKIVEMLEEHGKKLDNLEESVSKGNRVNEDGFKNVVSELKNLRESLIRPATNENKVPLSTHTAVVKTLCWVVFMVIVWFTGFQPHFNEIMNLFKKI